MSCNKECDVCKNDSNPSKNSSFLNCENEQECETEAAEECSEEESEFSCSTSKNNSNEALCPPSKPFDCDVGYSPSGMKPPKTTGPLGKRKERCSKYAPCGHWNTCTEEGHQRNKLFEGMDTKITRGRIIGYEYKNFALNSKISAPFGPYGPWNKYGPSRFKTPLQKVINRQFPKRDKCMKMGEKNPMGKIRPWPLAGSCRYGGRPYGPCRPFGAYRARGPFGIWESSECEFHLLRARTPEQPCWAPRKPGYRPCTPCHRPLFRACRPQKNDAC